jgi:putative ABC transport system permease protein
MMIKSTINEAFRSLYSAKQRTILALIGIVIGIGSVIAMISVGQIVQTEALRQFKDLGTDILTVQKGAAALKADGSSRARASSALKLQDILDIPSNCPAVSSIAPYVNVPGSYSYGGKPFEETSAFGVTQSFSDLNKLKVIEGRFLSEVDAMSQFCVLGNKVYSRMKERGAKEVVGQKIKIAGRLFTVIGVLGVTSTGGMRTFDANQSILIHITTALRMSTRNEISFISARVKSGISNVAAQGQVNDYFLKKVKRQDMQVISPEEMIAAMEEQMAMFTLLLGAIGSISLIVGGVGVMNVMLVSVSERRKEIGIRRALGAWRKDIKSQFLIESLILSFIGGMLGILLGILASYIVCYFANWGFLISYGAILVGFGVSSVVGVFFGYYPASQAAKLDPIVALRSG